MADGINPIGNLIGKVNANNALVVTLDGGLAAATRITLTQGTITADAPVISATTTWNNVATTFNGIKLVVTDTASASASRPLNILGGAAGTTELFYVRADGTVFAPTSSFSGVGFTVNSAGGSIQMLGKPVMIATAPTIASGFGASPSIVSANGTAAFTVNVGTGGTATAGVITMPAATTGWICHVENLTGTLGNYANQRTVQIASTTTSITIENQTISTGAVLAWTASDVLVITATAY